MEHSECESAIGLTRLINIQMALRTIIELNIPDIMASSEPHLLSAADLVSKIPTTNSVQAAANLDRILRYLAWQSLLTVTHQPDQHHNATHCYGLTRLSRHLTTDGCHGVSFASTMLVVTERETMESYYRLKDMVVDPEGGGSAFERAQGQSFYEYLIKKPGMKRLFDEFMSNKSKTMMERVLKSYDGFKDVKEVMDVGGGNGTVLYQIVSAYPHIRGINLDLKDAIDNAPIFSDVEHVAGNMFEALPQAETIQLKHVLHNWSDEECKSLLRNCWAALPKKGKVIVIECVVPEGKGSSMEEWGEAIEHDFAMMLLLTAARERTIAEFESMAVSAGFAQTIIFPVGQGLYVFEFIKT